MKYPQAILFDLDGTLLDTAPDLGAATNHLRIQHGLPPLRLEQYRPMASTGGRGMLKIGFNLKPQDTHYEQLLPQFFDAYEAQQNHNSHFFEDIQTVLKEIESLAITWGIVTNKAHRFFDPLPQQKPLLAKAGVVICGDTTPYRKPHPAPLLTAAKRLQVMPEACWYVGDDKRDIEAAKAAGMYAIAAHWGYLGEHPVESWQPDVVLEEPIQLLSLLKEAV